jgi:hypothetical protein
MTEFRDTLAKMKVGQSTVIDGDRADVNTRLYRAAKQAGVKITARKLNPNAKPDSGYFGSGYRVWLVGKARK